MDAFDFGSPGMLSEDARRTAQSIFLLKRIRAEWRTSRGSEDTASHMLRNTPFEQRDGSYLHQAHAIVVRTISVSYSDPYTPLLPRSISLVIAHPIPANPSS